MQPEPNKLVMIDNPFDRLTRRIVTIPYDPARSLNDLAGLGELGPDITIVKNGLIMAADDWAQPVMPGDMVHVFSTPADDTLKSLGMLAVTVIAYYYVGPAATGYLTEAGMSAGAAEMWGMLAAAAVVTAGGMLINGNMAMPSLTGNSKEESPTYGWSVGANTAAEGVAIPVIYGHEATFPQIINQWLEVDANYDQWWHVLLSVAQGKTNNLPTADDIQVGSQPITVLDENSYVIGTTDGSATPDTSALSKHQKLHQMRGLNKELVIASMSQILLHCNGADASTDIIDDGIGTAGDWHIPGITDGINTWTAQNTAALSTAHPFVGTAALNIETSGDYIDLDNWMAMALWTQPVWDFECRFRQDALTDSGIIGQSWVQTGVISYYWGIFYNAAGQLVYQQWSVTSGPSYTVYIDLKVSATLSIDTWHHVRVARSADTVYIFLDGVLLGSGAFSTTPDYAAGAVLDTGNLNVGDIYCIVDTETDHFYQGCESGQTFEAEAATALDANNTVRSVSVGSYGQWVGRGHYYDSGGPSSSVRYGVCELDEIRLKFYELNYNLTGFTAPANPIADEGEQEYTTRGSVDSFSITVTCPYGLYYARTDGALDNSAIDMWLSYRKEGESTWTRQFIWIWTSSRNPVTRQWTVEPAAGRGKYIIRLTRITWAFEITEPADRFQTTAYLMAVDEILHESLSYPHLQLVSLSLKAQEKISGRVPPVRITSNRTEIEVPNYSGSGTRLIDCTNNAHATFDMLTNRISGVGLDADRIVAAGWEQWADWCDGSVAGNRRCQLNMAFDASYDLDAALQHVEACGRAKVVNRGSKIMAIVDAPSGVVDLFCHENITPGTAKTTWLRQAEKSDAVEISYRDEAQDFTDQSVFYPGSGYYSLTRTPRVTRMTMLGINNQDQALREAILRQQLSESIKRAISLQSGIESLKVTVGDVIDYASKGNLLAFTGRLARGAAREEQYTGTVAYLDKEITLDSATFSANCIMVVRNADDSMQQLTVTGPFDTATWSVNISVSTTFDFLSPFIIGRASGEKYKYKINTVSRSSQKEALITAMQYDESAYYNDGYDSGSVAI